jgi:hypothetical protein
MSLFNMSNDTISVIKDLGDFLATSPHYQRMAGEERQRLELKRFTERGNVNDLARIAGGFFRLVQDECDGVLRFEPSKTKVGYEGPYCWVDSTGKSKNGLPLGWVLKGDNKLLKLLHESSELEMEVWRRVINGDVITNPVEVYNVTLSPEILNDTFSKHYRNFGSTHNGKPATIESAFNHIRALHRPLKVKGFQYPYPESKLVFQLD